MKHRRLLRWRRLNTMQNKKCLFVMPAKAGIQNLPVKNLDACFRCSIKHARTWRKSTRGFTLLEILIALFIFTVLSMILVAALRSVIDAHSGTEKSAERLRRLQISLLVMSRDIEQAVNRPVLNIVGKEESAFTGTTHGFTFTHAGYANPDSTLARSSLQRTAYSWRDNALWRLSWNVLDQAPETRSHARELQKDVLEARFEYLDKEGHFRDGWPVPGDEQPLPRAVRVLLTIDHWGKISQLYLVPAQPETVVQLPGKPPGTSPSADKPKKSAADDGERE
jgi:general secretion pathway protein J